jgi:photosystem II stability/assembly factor-like uncharacterized protein
MLKRSISWFVSECVLFALLVGLVLIQGLSPNLLFAGKKSHCDLFAVSFPEENYGWACGRSGTVLHTTDGGHQWERQQSGVTYTLTAIWFVDSTNGWAVGDGGTIVHTSDGGRTWTPQDSPVDYYLMDVEFVSALEGWIVTERTTILYTKDGGVTWKIQFSDEDFILKAVSFADADNGWAVGEFGFIYHTANGGASWEKQAGEFSYSTETLGIEGGNYLFDIATLSDTEAWVVGIGGYVARTTDAGRTWEQIPNTTTDTLLLAVLIASDKTIFSAGKGVLLHRDNQSGAWKNQRLTPPNRYGWLYGLADRKKAGYVAVGKEGSIYIADASGDNWVAGKVNW